jgi:hypothetical protein
LNERRLWKKTELLKHHQRQRLEWALTVRGWTTDDWKNFLLSDKSKVSLGIAFCVAGTKGFHQSPAIALPSRRPVE